jgi:hypothetical protein
MKLAGLRGARLALLTISVFLIARGASRADVNPTPIAIPLIGTQQIASPYPSTLNVVARGGPSQTGPISVVLHGVTHPCPRDLSVVLVHNDERYLILNNVGGCRPLEGTTIEIVDNLGDPTIPPFPPDSPPFPDYIKVAASFSGPQPTMPPPFPAGGGLISGFPGTATLIDGRWDLYVIDKVAGGRGVIAGGWSLHYDTTIRSLFRQVTLVPRGGFSSGPAAVYPIRFDLSEALDSLRASNVTLTVDFSHQKPDDLVIVLQSPTGTAVMLMANAGGAINCPGVEITFDDAALGSRPLNAGPLPTGTGIRFLPTEWPEVVPASVPAPGPQPPYRNALFAFRDEPVRGVWTLWVYDDSTNGTGLLAGAALTIATEQLPNATVTSPTATSTSTQPFVRVEGRLAGNDRRGDHATWRVTNGGAWYAAGAFSVDPQTGNFVADVPVKRGTNTIQYRGWNTGRAADVDSVQVTVNELTYSLAEGATGPFFDLDVTLANPSAVNAPVRIDLLPEGGAPLAHLAAATPTAPLQIEVDDLVPTAAVSTVVHSIDAVPLAVERTMSWDTRGYGGHGGTAVSPATRWLFAEGAQGFFKTFVLLTNDNATPVEVTIRFLLEGGGVVTHRAMVAAHSRHTVHAGDVPGMVDRSFGLDITAPAPIIAERAMYFSLEGRPDFDGGHESAGVSQPSTSWFLAEGATGPFFDCFVLLSNPNATQANVTLTYLLTDGRTITQTTTVAGNGRRTIDVARVDDRLVNAAVSTTIRSDIGIVAERAMYWPSGNWQEAHNSFGVTDAGLRWAVADGRIGGTRSYTTYILLANPNPAPAEVQVRFIKAGVTATRSYTLPPTSRVNIEPRVDVPELGNGVFSAEIEVLNFQPIAVEKAMYWDASGVAWAAGTNVTATRLPPR